MSKVKMIECYDYDENYYLIEMVLDENSEDVDIDAVIATDPDLEEQDWTLAISAQYLNADGTALISEPYEKPEPTEPCRLVFFVDNFESKLLVTPYGEFELEGGNPLPKRLAEIVKFVEE
jgi:hypothetical protein